jgi:hypothetical protein
LRYLSYDSLSNNFKIILDKGNVKELNDKTIEETSKELLNYFFVGLSLPNGSFWVNLRPDSPDNIIDESLAQTEIGRILLEADLQLKKDTALATSPQTPEGKNYWDKLYQKAEELFGQENITIPTLTRPWIVPDEILIQESQDSAYIYKATLKVMLEQDYLKDSVTYSFRDSRLKELNEYSSQLIRESIIPKITKEINSSKRYAKLRQVYYSLIFAQWFKKQFAGKNGVYPTFIDSRDLNNLTTWQPYSKEYYFQEYQKSFKDGEYNVKEPRYTPYGQIIRSYFSGGVAIQETPGVGFGGNIPLGLLQRPGVSLNVQGASRLGMETVQRTPSQAAGIKNNNTSNEEAGAYIALRLKEMGFGFEADQGLESRKAKLDAMIAAKKAEAKRNWRTGEDVVFIKIPGLLNPKEQRNQFAHIGFGRTYGRTVVYIDEQYADYAVIENHEFAEIEFWMDEVRTNPSLKGYSLENIRDWMLLNLAAAVEITDRLHKKANSAPGCNIDALARDLGIPIAPEGQVELVEGQETPSVAAVLPANRNEYSILYRQLTEKTRSFESIQSLAETLRNLRPGETIVTDPFQSIAEIESLLKYVGSEFEIGFCGYISPEEWEGPLNANFVVVLKKNGHLGVLVYRTGRRVIIKEENITKIFERWGIVARQGAQITLIRGGKDSVSQESDFYSAGHSHPSGEFALGASEASEHGGDMVAFVNSMANKAEAVPALTVEEWNEPKSNPNIPQNQRVYMLDYDGEVKIITTAEAEERINMSEVYYTETSRGETVVIHNDIMSFETVDRTGRVTGHCSKTYLRPGEGLDVEIFHDARGYQMRFLRTPTGQRSNSWLGPFSTRTTIHYENSPPEAITNSDGSLNCIAMNEGGQRYVLTKTGWFLYTRGRTGQSKMPETERDFFRSRIIASFTGNRNLQEAYSSLVKSTGGDSVSASASTGRRDPPIPPTGGIDFRSLPILSIAIHNLSFNGNNAALNNLKDVNLPQEWPEIENLVNAGIMPSGERIKEYIQGACIQNEAYDSMDKVILCIADIFRSDEENYVLTDSALRDILIVFTSGISTSELKRIFTGVKS